MESLAMGVPAITIDSRGCRDVVRNGVDGFVLSSASAKDITRAAAVLATDRQVRETMRAAAIAGRSRFDRRIYNTEQVTLYAQLLGREAGPSTGGTFAFPSHV
jgi:glycosyltransferase involved in cell wall biosynthesis